MKFVFQEELQTMIHHYELELLLHKKLGKDLGDLTLSFLTEVPAPWCWPITPMPSPWVSRNICRQVSQLSCR